MTKLRRKGITTVIAISLAIILLIIAVYIFKQKLHHTVYEINDIYLEETVTQQMISFNAKLMGQISQLQLFSRCFENVDLKDYNAIKEAINVSDGFGEFKRISVVNKKGVVINNDNTTSPNVLKEDYFVSAMSGEMFLSTSLQMDEDGEEIFILAVPIYKKGEIIGALAGTFNRRDLEGIFTEDSFSGNGYSYLIDKDGSIVLEYTNAKINIQEENFFNFLHKVKTEDSSIVAQIKEDFELNKEGRVQYIYQTEKTTMFYKKTQFKDLYLVTMIQEQFIETQSNVISVYVGTLVLIIFSVVSILVVYVVSVSRANQRVVQTNEVLKDRAEKDLLTNLLNKTSTQDYIDHWIINEGGNKLGGLIIMDLDNFKSVNDTLGHVQGDQILQDVAEQLVSTFRKEDYIGRIGGDEFIIFIKAEHEAEDKLQKILRRKSEDICRVVRKEFRGEGYHFFMSASVGIALYSKDGMNFQELYQNADKALYLSKRKGKNQFSFYQEVIKEEEHEKNTSETFTGK